MLSVRGGLVLFGVGLVCLMFGASSVSAAPQPFGPDGTSATVFGVPGAIGVDQATGGLYVADVERVGGAGNSVEKFSAAHAPEAFTGSAPNIVQGRLTGLALQGVSELAIDSASHNFYVASNGSQSVKAFQADGEPMIFTAGPGAGTNEIHGFGELIGVAVDSNGEIYASDYLSGVHVYGPSGEALATFSDFGNGYVAVDSHGTVYVNNFESTVEKFVPTFYPVTPSTIYASAGVVDGNVATSVTVDPSNDHLFVDERTRIVEYDEAGGLVGTFGGSGVLTDSEGVAVNATTGKVYASDKAGNHQVEIFGASTEVPDVTTSAASSLRTSARLNGTVNPDGEGKATCQFLWGETEALGHTAPCSADVPEGNAPVAVSADIGGLVVNTNYFYRLQATNKNGTNPGEPSQDQEFTTLGAGIHDQSVSNVASTSATLQATIDPNNSPTTYYFQYGTDTAYGSEIPASPGVAIGSIKGDLSVSQHLQGLSASTTYHYRVVAISELSPGVFESFEGSDETFTTQQTGTQFALPDGRQWELVSPPNKHGALVEPLGRGTAQAAVDGGAVTYSASVPTESEPQGYAQNAQVVSVRGAQGWSSRDISPPHSLPTSGIEGNEFPLFSSDLSSSLVWLGGTDATLLSDKASELTSYVRNSALCDVPATASECYTPILTGKEGFADVQPETEFAGPLSILGYNNWVQGATPDLKHVLLKTQFALVPPVVGEGDQVYEWSAGAPAAQALQVVSIVPASEGGGPSPNGASAGSDSGGPYGASDHAISDDGSRVFWTIGDNTGRASLYMRDTVKHETVALDAPQPSAPSNGSKTLYSQFEIASSDGSKAFFTSGELFAGIKGELLTAQSGQSGRDLYECEIVEEAGKLKCKFTDLTPEVGGHSAEVLDVVSGASEDGSYLYFVANGVLGDGAEHGAQQGSCKSFTGGVGAAGATCNLYVYHGGKVTFITTLSVDDEFDWGAESKNMGPVTARVSPDGRFFTFMSQRSLTGYDNRDAKSGRPDMEVYLYDAVNKHLSCVSCNPTGSRPVGIEVNEFTPLNGGSHSGNVVNVARGAAKSFGPSSWVASNLPWPDFVAVDTALYQPRLVSDNGRVFFNSNDALVPQDVNGNEDVYEFEPVGVGSCTASSVTFSPVSGGCVGLVSSGTSPEESGFLDASQGGGDVYFLTVSRLTSRDYDGSFDVYDAHECSASAPCAAPVVSAPPCSSGDSCKPSPSLQPPIFGAPPSAMFTGAGNVTSFPSSVVTGRSLTRTQKLVRALRACRKRPKRKRAVCEGRARGRYGARGARNATRKARG
jgi:hypothetical protein